MFTQHILKSIIGTASLTQKIIIVTSAQCSHGGYSASSMKYDVTKDDITMEPEYLMLTVSSRRGETCTIDMQEFNTTGQTVYVPYENVVQVMILD